ncbi:hypothetical protein BTN49_1815 [Candidatus Enterovibrio escicola]|uniref:Uncharacterized protein n=3 Tax=Candidatus Enterovibrio escicola TaxID=1927127 RepID=A0A2A5T389_9GAMM|nr:hypothetical protein BTN49_1815 [Candidatus Enterovibrio escacola]
MVHLQNILIVELLTQNASKSWVRNQLQVWLGRDLSNSSLSSFFHALASRDTLSQYGKIH